MNWQPQLKYAYHRNMMIQGKIYHILLDIMKKPGKKRNIFRWIQLQGKAHYEQYSPKDSQLSRSIFSILMLPGINSPKISPICTTFTHLSRRISIHSSVYSSVMGMELAGRVSVSLKRGEGRAWVLK